MILADDTDASGVAQFLQPRTCDDRLRCKVWPYVVINVARAVLPAFRGQLAASFRTRYRFPKKQEGVLTSF